MQPNNQQLSEEFVDGNEPWLLIGIPSTDPFLVTQYLERHSVGSDQHMKKPCSSELRSIFAFLCVLRFGCEPRKTAGPILRGAARSRTLQEGPRRLLRVGGEPGKTAGHPHENRVVLRLPEMQGWNAWVVVRQLVALHTPALPPLGINSWRCAKLDDIFTDVGILAK